ncbi:MAG: hypothetical protein BJ554DRAFT_5005 [Olpidium bornovanus]|uniref:26S proteasome complex subunit SEM1 n=1 Tax=Olpidium bornovanus TaxID=278681 RepID=A0A8H7ZLQ3_9FUNG|nr:MAG: hypothetical protein BJ554DRAFT_5005 [Olpidium bornovanus]
MASKKAGDPAAKAAKPAQGKGEKADAEMKDTPSAATGDGKKETAPEEDKGAAGALEEDDEFEEFVAEARGRRGEGPAPGLGFEATGYEGGRGATRDAPKNSPHERRRFAGKRAGQQTSQPRRNRKGWSRGFWKRGGRCRRFPEKHTEQCAIDSGDPKQWNDDDEARDQNLWEDNWDDDDVEDDFSKQLRAELERAHPMKM